MMKQPRERTREEQERRIKRIMLYDYYGIPYLLFDEDVPEDEDKYIRTMKKDWLEASMLITLGESIPSDLEKRLFKYKERNEREGKFKPLD